MAQRGKQVRFRQDLGSASDLFLNAANPSMSETHLDGKTQEKKAGCQSLNYELTLAKKPPVPYRKNVSATNDVCFRLAGVGQSRDEYPVIRQYC